MDDLDEKLHELDNLYQGTSDDLVADAQPLDCVRTLFYDALADAYGAIPEAARAKFEQCLGEYETLDVVLQRRFRGAIVRASVMARVAERRKEAIGYVLTIAQLLPLAFNGLGEREEERAIRVLRHYLDADHDNPAGPYIEEEFCALSSELARLAS
ncbi:hypothetical protein HY642_05370 [Candidatus Woesearchaeota archaeon]|nr:hypothetical protein [Candidatus Woesearchaeota archaeon]